MNSKKKVALGVIMGLGSMYVYASVTLISANVQQCERCSHRSYSLYYLSFPFKRFSLYVTYNCFSVRPITIITGTTVDVSIWSSVEPGIGLIAISLAALRPLLTSVLAGFSSSSGTAEKSASKHFGTKHYGSKHYGKMSNVKSLPNAHTQPQSSFNTAWEEEEENALQLRGLPPPTGHFVLIEGGLGHLKQSPTKLQKSPSTSGNSGSSVSPKKSLSGRNSEEGFFGEKNTITMTQDFKRYSGNGSDNLVSVFGLE